MLKLALVANEVAGGQLDLLANAPLGIGHEAGHIAAADVDLHDAPAFGPVAVDGGGPLDGGDVSQVPEFQLLPGCGADLQFGQGPGIAAVLIGQAYGEGKAHLVLANLAHRNVAYRGDEVEHLVRGQAMAGQLGLAQADLQHRLPGELLDHRVGGPGHLAKHAFDALGQLGQGVKVIPEDLDPQIAADARDQLVDPQLDGLGEDGPHAGHVAEQALHLRDQGLLGSRLLPLGSRMQGQENVGQLHAHGVGGHLGGAGSRPDVADLVGEVLFEQLLQAGAITHRFLDRDARQADGVDDHRLFGEPGNEDGAQSRGNQQAHDRQDDQQGQGHRPAAQHEAQHRGVQPLEAADQQRFAMGDPGRQQQAGQYRNDGQREDQRTGQGEDHRPGHGREHLAFDVLQGQDRQIHDHDDQLAEEGRAANLDGGVANHLQHRAVPGDGQMADRVLDRDHRAVHDQPEVNGPQAHQAAGDARPQHEVAGKQHRQGDGRGHDQPRAEIAQEEQQHDQDQDGPFQQVGPHRPQDMVDDLGAVIDGGHLDVGGQGGQDVAHGRLEGGGDLVAVVAHEHEAQAHDRLAAAVEGDRTRPNLVAFHRLADVADVDGHAALGGDDNVPDLVERLE